MKISVQSRCLIIFCLFLFTQSVKAQDDNWVLKIGRLYDNGNYQEAVVEARKYIAKYPDDARLYSLNGWILSKLGENGRSRTKL